jgi:transcription elongation factor GreA
MPSDETITVGDIYNSYLESLKPEQRGAEGMYVRKFCEFVGFEMRVVTLAGSRVDSYVEAYIRDSDPNAGDRVQALKRWFQYLKKQGHLETNFGARVRMPRQPLRARGGASRRLEPTAIEMTSEGIDRLQRELDDLEAQQTDLKQAVARAMEDKDFRENAPLDAAREALAFNQSRSASLRSSLKRAVVAGASGDGRVGLGSTVKVTRVETGTEHTYILVSAQEANARENRISVESPVGARLLGRAAGDEINVDVPSGTLHLRVDEVRA